MSTFSINLDLAALDRTIGGMTADCEAAARPAAQAMAQVLYDDVKGRATGLGRKTGNLSASIYQAFSERLSVDGRAVYHVSWNPRKAPHGHLVEFGHVMTHAAYFDEKRQRWFTDKRRPVKPRQVAAQPFVRPAIARFPQAQQVGHDRYLQELKERGVLR